MDHETGQQSTTEVEETSSFGVQEVNQHYSTDDNVIVKDNLDVKPTNQVVSPCYDEDTWWFFSPPEMDQKAMEEEEEEETSSIRNLDKENERQTEGENIVVAEEKSAEGEEEEEDSLDTTWKAIMESKGKESGPNLKKSDTWSAGDGGGDERRKERRGVIGGLSQYRVTVQLKKWQSFREMMEKREFRSGGVDGRDSGGGGGGRRGWKSVDMALTFHDELKKRADSFIAKFTHDIRLQRLESNQRFMEMMNRSL